MNWREVPFLRVLMPFASGILLKDWFFSDMVGTHPVFSLGAVLLLSLLWGIHFFRPAFKSRALFGIFLQFSLLALGCLVTFWGDPRSCTNYLGNRVHRAIRVKGNIQEVKPTTRGWRLTAKLIAGEDSSGVTAITGRLLIYLPNSSPPRIGDHILVYSGTIQSIPPPSNPKAFDFANYMARRGVYHQVFLREGEFQLIPSRSFFRLRVLADRIRRHGLMVLKKHLQDEEAFAVGAALILGYRDAIGEELRTAYARTGATHILAVSGLHVGLIYLVLSFMLSRLPLTGVRWRYLKSLLMIIGIWAFVFIAGLSPSAVRAGTMFSFFIVGRAGEREPNIFNLLAASAFCLLMLHPPWLFDVGFQLSYTAVASIVCFQPLIYRLLFFKQVIPDYLWRLLSLSFAAQIGTLPLSLFYFHQFPVYFWLSGLVAVPAAGIILGGGLSLMLLHPIPSVGPLAGELLELIIQGLNACVGLIHQLPAGQVSGIWIEAPLVVFLYLLIGLLLLTWRNGNKRSLVAGLMVCCSCLIYRAVNRWKLYQDSQIVVYQISGHSLIDLVDGNRHLALMDEELSERAIQFAAQNYRWSRQLEESVSIQLSDTLLANPWCYRTGLIQFADHQVFILGPETVVEHLPEMEVDILILRAAPDLVLADLIEKIRFKLLVLDASNSPAYLKSKKETCLQLGIPFLDIRQQGGQVIKLKAY